MFLNLCSFTVQLVRVKSEAGQDRSKLFGVSYTKKKTAGMFMGFPLGFFS